MVTGPGTLEMITLNGGEIRLDTRSSGLSSMGERPTAEAARIWVGVIDAIACLPRRIDSFTADRSPTGRYRVTPLEGLFARTKRGWYHDGRFSDLAAVVEHYDDCKGLALTDAEKRDLVQYLRSR